MLGRWENGESSEQWTAAGNVFWGVAFGPGSSFDVMRIDAEKGAVRFVGQPNGSAPVQFPRVDAEEGSVTFLNPAHDNPKRVRYAVKGRKLVAGVGPETGPDDLTWKLRGLDPVAVEALEEADRAFARDVAERGVDG